MVGVLDRPRVLAELDRGTGVPDVLEGSEWRVFDAADEADACSEGNELVESIDNRGWTTAWPVAYILY